MSGPAPLLSTEELASADDFVARLDPSPGLWPPDPRGWLFRGHANDAWSLVPAALRPDVRLSVDPGDARRGPRPTHGEQTRAEHDMLRRFFRALDERGLQIPEDSQRQRTASGLHGWGGDIVDTAAGGETPWPPVELWSQMALAQHYGIPTRLLDWALSAHIAAYFAAKRAAQWLTGVRKRPEGVTHLSVWAFHARVLAALERARFHSPLAVVTAPGAVIPNIVGQRGVFTVHQLRAREGAPVDVATHDRIVIDALSEIGDERLARARLAPPVFVRLRLALGHAPRVLRLLAYRGIDASLVFAGHQGAAEAVLEEALWDELPDSAVPLHSQPYER